MSCFPRTQKPRICFPRHPAEGARQIPPYFRSLGPRLREAPWGPQGQVRQGVCDSGSARQKRNGVRSPLCGVGQLASHFLRFLIPGGEGAMQTSLVHILERGVVQNMLAASRCKKMQAAAGSRPTREGRRSTPCVTSVSSSTARYRRNASATRSQSCKAEFADSPLASSVDGPRISQRRNQATVDIKKGGRESAPAIHGDGRTYVQMHRNEGDRVPPRRRAIPPSTKLKKILRNPPEAGQIPVRANTKTLF